MEVVLRLPNGEDTVVDVEVDWTVEKLRERVEEAAGYSGVRLMLGEEELRGEDMLCDTGLTGDSVVVVSRGLSKKDVERCIEYLQKRAEGQGKKKKALLEDIDRDLSMPATDNEDVVLHALRMEPTARELRYVGRLLWTDRDAVRRLLAEWQGNWKQLSGALEEHADWVWGDEEASLSLVRLKGSLLEYVRSPSKEVVLAAIQREGAAFRSAPVEHRRDVDVVLAALEKSPGVSDSIPCEVWTDRDAVRRLVTYDGSLLHLAAEEIRADREIVRAAVANNPAAIMDAPPEMLEDRELVLECLAPLVHCIQRESPLRYLGSRNQDDKELVLIAVSRGGAALLEASPRLRGDLDVVAASVKYNPESLMYAMEPARSDPGIRALTAEELRVQCARRIRDRPGDLLEQFGL